MKKYCKICGELGAFKNGYYRTTCKKHENRKFRDKRRDLTDSIKLNRGCENPECCWTGKFIPIQLQFDHIDPSEKLFNISEGYETPIEELYAEIDKCIVLCANCHAHKTRMCEDFYKR